jgi:hypothetical protein
LTNTWGAPISPTNKKNGIFEVDMCCMVCLEWEKGKLDVKDALRNLGEMIQTGLEKEDIDHYFEVAEKLTKDQNETPQT